MQMRLLFILGSTPGKKDNEAVILISLQKTFISKAFKFKGNFTFGLSLIYKINCLLKWLICSWINFIKNNNGNIDKRNQLSVPRWNKMNPHLYIIRWKICMLYSNLIWMNACTQQDCCLHLWSSSLTELALVFNDSEIKLKTILRGIKLINISLLSFHHNFLPKPYALSTVFWED